MFQRILITCLIFIFLFSCTVKTDKKSAKNSSGFNVTEVSDLGGNRPCPDDSNCVDDYFNFVKIASKYGKAVTEEEFNRQVQSTFEQKSEPAQITIPEAKLRDTLIEKLNVGFLRNGINERELTVRIIKEQIEHPNYLERELIFIDPWIGSFRALILTPKTPGPHPAVIALPGHNETAEYYRDNYFGRKYPANGYAVLIISPRAFDASSQEDLVTRAMLKNGFTMMGVRHYETVLALKYLRYLSDIDGAKIGLIGHSGGSVSANLTYWLESGFAACVSDNNGEYFSLNSSGKMSDEMVPALYPYHLLINRLNGETPALTVEYGYVNSEPIIFSFFDRHLKDTAQPNAAVSSSGP